MEPVDFYDGGSAPHLYLPDFYRLVFFPLFPSVFFAEKGRGELVGAKARKKNKLRPF